MDSRRLPSDGYLSPGSAGQQAMQGGDDDGDSEAPFVVGRTKRGIGGPPSHSHHHPSPHWSDTRSPDPHYATRHATSPAGLSGSASPYAAADGIISNVAAASRAAAVHPSPQPRFDLRRSWAVEEPGSWDRKQQAPGSPHDHGGLPSRDVLGPAASSAAAGTGMMASPGGFRLRPLRGHSLQVERPPVDKAVLPPHATARDVSAPLSTGVHASRNAERTGPRMGGADAPASYFGASAATGHGPSVLKRQESAFMDAVPPSPDRRMGLSSKHTGARAKPVDAIHTRGSPTAGGPSASDNQPASDPRPSTVTAPKERPATATSKDRPGTASSKDRDAQDLDTLKAIAQVLLSSPPATPPVIALPTVNEAEGSGEDSASMERCTMAGTTVSSKPPLSIDDTFQLRRGTRKTSLEFCRLPTTDREVCANGETFESVRRKYVDPIIAPPSPGGHDAHASQHGSSLSSSSSSAARAERSAAAHSANNPFSRGRLAALQDRLLQQLGPQLDPVLSIMRALYGRAPDSFRHDLAAALEAADVPKTITGSFSAVLGDLEHLAVIEQLLEHREHDSSAAF